MDTVNEVEETVYQRNGFDNRAAYLADLAENYPASIVYALADMLGESEDFDGLVTSLEDYEMMEGF